MSKQLHCSNIHLDIVSYRQKPIKYENVELKGKINAKDMQIEQCKNTIDHLRELYVAHAKIPGLDNLGIIVHKYTSKDNDKHFDYPYHIVSIQL